MHLIYQSLFEEMRRIYRMPRDMGRFRVYLATMTDASQEDLAFPPLVLINPMAREHLLDYVESLIAMDADEIVRSAINESAADVQDVPDSFSMSLVVMDDLKGGWTNRYSYELNGRRMPNPRNLPPRQRDRFWVTGVLWSSEPPQAAAVRRAALQSIYRTYYVVKHGTARTLGEILRQDGWVLRKADYEFPRLDPASRTRTCEVLELCADCDDVGTLIECLFGAEAAATLGYSGWGLAPWAGVSLATENASA
ncbi:MAG: hypothetical protein FJ295_03355 [Planctomycetes bacterium]|nr:hypothetical protein [Planctomycetota bacterium]